MSAHDREDSPAGRANRTRRRRSYRTRVTDVQTSFEPLEAEAGRTARDNRRAQVL
ncbi:MAG: hypothetical protein P4K83_07815 [Terracidiphilus sp.]|nr:hypothetical protein [Terracidiphilus sp.]